MHVNARAVDSLSWLLRATTTLDAKLGQKVDVVLTQLRNLDSDHLLELLSGDHFAGVLPLFVTESLVNLLTQVLDLLQALIEEHRAALKFSGSNDPFGDLKHGCDDFSVDDLLNQIVNKDSLGPILVCKCRDQIEILFTDLKLDKLKNLSKLCVSDETTFLGEDAKDVLKVESISFRMHLDLPENVLVVLHGVDRPLDVEFEFVIPASLARFLLTHEKSNELIVVDGAVVAQTLELVLEANHL